MALNRVRRPISWTLVSVMCSTRNSVGWMFFWSSLPLATSLGAAPGLEHARVEENDQGGVDGVLGPAVGRGRELLANSVPFLPLPTKSRTALQTGCLSGSPLCPTAARASPSPFLRPLDDLVPVGRGRPGGTVGRAGRDRALAASWTLSSSSIEPLTSIATGEVDRRLVEDVVDQVVPGLLGHVLSRVSIAFLASIPSGVFGLPLVWSVVLAA